MSYLTKKNYEAIAQALNETGASIETVVAVSRAMERTNPGFDKQRFWHVATMRRDESGRLVMVQYPSAAMREAI